MAEFELTRLARAIAETKYSVAAVKEKATREMGNFPDITIDDVAAKGKFLHCFGMSGRAEDTDDIEFVILGHNGTAYIDTVSYQNEVMDTGPFAGKTVCFPVPDTFSD